MKKLQRRELIGTKSITVGIKGKGVKPCLKASGEQKFKCREALEENRSKNVEKLLNVARLINDVIMSLSTCEEKEEEEEEGRTRKRPIVGNYIYIYIYWC